MRLAFCEIKLWERTKPFFILLLTGLLLYSTAAAQEGKDSSDFSSRLFKLYYQNSSGEKGVTTFAYNENGIRNKARWELLDSSRYSDNYYTYDLNGNLILKYREFSDGMISHLFYTYDTNGYLISENFMRSDSVNGITHYKYTDDGRLIKANCKGLNGWLHGIIEYVYNANGLKIKGNFFKDGTPAGTIEYTYDDDNKLIREYWDFNGKWNQTFNYENVNHKKVSITTFTSPNVFIPTTSGFRVVKETYNYSNQTGGPSFFKYGKNGELVEKIFKRSDGLSTKTNYEYNEQGVMIKSYRNYSNGLSAEFTYEFNGNRYLTHRSFIRSDGLSGSELYKYNGKWQITGAIYENFDSWLTGEISFDYNKNGYLSNAHFIGKPFNAEIEFTYAGNENICKIHWVFSSGNTQTYTFNYKSVNP